MIYIIEDDRGIRDLITYALDTEEYEVRTFSSGREFFADLNPAEARLIILDIMLPGQDGLSILKKLKSVPETAHIPVMIMSALGEERDKVKGLDLGADDYIGKPFGIMEFLARVRAQLRRTKSGAHISAGGISLNPGARTATADGQEVKLTAKEYNLLEYLMLRIGTVVQREEILGAVWGYTGGEETRTVDVHIRSIRSKLGRAGESIRTVRGAGYMVDKINAAQSE